MDSMTERPVTLADAVSDYLRLTSEPVVNRSQGTARLNAARAIYREWCDHPESNRWQAEMELQLALKGKRDD